MKKFAKRIDRLSKYGTVTKELAVKAFELTGKKGYGAIGVGYELFNAKTKAAALAIGNLAIDIGHYYYLNPEPIEGTKFARCCSKCGKGMNEGYCINEGESYLCSDKCLNKTFTATEWKNMYDDGDGESYYTEWDVNTDAQYITDKSGCIVEIETSQDAKPIEKMNFYIEFLNKDKGYQKDRKEFASHPEARDWMIANFDKYDSDMINYII